jgi:hypothetical protein
MLLFACRSGDAAFAIAFDGPVAEQGGGSFAERMTDRCAWARQLGQLGNEFSGERIADHNARRNLDERIARRPAVMADFVDGGIPSPDVIVSFDFTGIVHLIS